MEDWSLEIYEVEYLEFDEVVVMECPWTHT